MARFSIRKKRAFSRAFLEILLIFVGVNLSIGFTNWNQERKERQTEINILKEIYHDMEEDLADAQSTRRWFIKRQKAYRLLEEALDNDLPMNDSLKEYFPQLMGGSYINRNQVAYENYKSRGLEIITKDTLRVDIMRYYEENLPWLFKSEEFWETFSNKYLEELFIKHYNFSDNTPGNFEEIRKEKNIRSIAAIGRSLTVKLINLHSKLIESSTLIKQDIEKELFHLTGEEWPASTLHPEEENTAQENS